MEQYYKILFYLENSNVDRVYPVDAFYQLDEKGNKQSVEYIGDSFLFPTNKESFNGIDYIEVLLESSEEYEFQDLSLNFSEYVEGYSPVVVFNPVADGTLPVNVPIRVIFKVRKSLTMSEASRNYTNIKSIELITPNNNDFKLYDICFRDNNAKYTLEQLNHFYEVGVNHITSRLHMSAVPLDLDIQKYKATAGYTWNSSWEFDARIMQDEQKNALSYGKWLLAQVDTAIDEYKEANGIADDDEMFVKHDIVTHVPLRY